MAGCCLALIFQGVPSLANFFSQMKWTLDSTCLAPEKKTNVDGSLIGVAVSLQMKEIWHGCDLKPSLPPLFSQLLFWPPEHPHSPNSPSTLIVLSWSSQICLPTYHLCVPCISAPRPHLPTEHEGPYSSPSLTFLHSISCLLTYYVFHFI